MITFVILYHKNDFHYVPDCTASIPEYAKVILCRTEQIDAPNGIHQHYNTDFLEDITVNDNRTHCVYKYAGGFDFAKARNKVNTLVETEWIFSLDADERFSICHSKELLDVISTSPDDVWGLFVRNYSFYPMLTHQGEPLTATIKQCRVYRNKPEIKWFGTAHEVIDKCILEQDKQLVETSILIIHEGYKIPLEDFAAKLKRNIIRIGKHLNEEHYFNALLRETNTYIQIMERTKDVS